MDGAGAGGGLSAMETLLLGFVMTSVLVLIEVVLAIFSFLSMEELQEGFLSDGGGKKLVFLLNGGLLEGFSGGFFVAFSATVGFAYDIVEG